jgi:hypothetical protein
VARGDQAAVVDTKQVVTEKEAQEKLPEEESSQEIGENKPRMSIRSTEEWQKEKQRAPIKSVADWQKDYLATGLAPSANRCAPLKGPIPSKYWG